MKNSKFYLGIILIAIFAILMCSCTGSQNSNSDSDSIFKKTIDAKEYITIDYGKYNGYSSPSIEVNYEAISAQIDAETFNNFVNTLPNELRWEMRMYDCMADVFDIEFKEYYDNVYNGDKITVEISVEPYLEKEGLTLDKICNGLGIKFKNTEIEYTVSGLEEPKYLIDIFEDIEQYIVYEGANGNGWIGYYQFEIPKDYLKQVGELYFSKGSYTNSVKIIHNNIKIGEISYYIDGEKLSKGDVIEITTSCPITALENLGYVVSATRKNTTVPDLGDYLTSADQLTPTIVEAIKSKIYDEEGIDSIDKLYYSTYKPGVECSFDSTSFIVGIYYYNSWLFKGYRIVEINDIIIKPDGTIVVENYERGIAFYDTIEEATDALDEARYNFTDIK